jgi:hypothetical protein
MALKASCKPLTKDDGDVIYWRREHQLVIPNDECTVLLPIGTVVLMDNEFFKLTEPVSANFEKRGSTNYDNQRYGVLAFDDTPSWAMLKARDVLEKRSPLRPFEDPQNPLLH